MHLSVPNDVLDAMADSKIPPMERPEAGRRKAPAALAKAKRPLVIAGPAAMRQQPKGKFPVIGMESPRGVNDPSLGKLADVLAKADVVLLLGKRIDFTLKFGKIFAKSCRVAARLWRRGASGSHRITEGVVRRSARRRSLTGRRSGRTIQDTLHPVVVCREVQKLLDCARRGVRLRRRRVRPVGAGLPRRRRGASSTASPARSARRCRSPRRRSSRFRDAPVVALLGDGTLGFHLSEIDTAVRYGLPYVAVVGNDACWNAEYQIQLRAYGAARAHGLDLLPTRYGAVAAALGAHGEDVLKPEELAPAWRAPSRRRSRRWST